MEWVEDLRNEVPAHVLTVVDHVWRQRDLFVRWPQRALCFWPGCVRVQYHQYGTEHRAQLRKAGIRIDGRSNGPAIMAFLLGGGDRPHATSQAGNGACITFTTESFHVPAGPIQLMP